MNIQEIFNQLFDCKAENLKHDYIKAVLTIELRDLETNEMHKVIFHNVVSLLWTIDIEPENTICKNIFPELSSIIFSRVKITTDNEWLKGYPLDFNVCIEIMDRALLVNSSIVEIDSKKYYINASSTENQADR